MPSAARVRVYDVQFYEERYSREELVDLRRTMLLYARSLPRGSMRNDKRQIASSLRTLFRNGEWLKEHTI